MKVTPVMWGDQIFYADSRNAKTDAQGRLRINGIIPGMEYYVMDSRAESESGDMYYNEIRVLIPLKEKERKIVSFEEFDIAFDMDQAKGKRLLICFWDMDQRPSRNCITQLAIQVEQLKEKGVTIVAVQASKVDENTLGEWVKKNSIPFPVGMIQGDEEQTRSTWGVKSLPWLILTDPEHVVIAEGFQLGELANQLKQGGGNESGDGT